MADDDYAEERRISRDRNTIRDWSDQHGYVPVRHRDRDDVTLVSEDRMEEDHERLDWDDFHSHLDEEERVVTHDEAADEPLEVTDHTTAADQVGIEREELQNRLLEGEVVTTQIEETTVVETVVVEEASLESELIDTEIVDDQIADVELLERTCTGCDVVESGRMENEDWFDRDRFLTSLRDSRDYESRTLVDDDTMRTSGTTDDEAMGTSGTMDDDTMRTSDTMDDEAMATDETTDDDVVETDETTTTGTTATDLEESRVEREFPYDVELDVQESWAVQREITERYTVESRIADTHVSEADTIEDHDIDIEGLQRSIVEQGLIGQAEERDPDEILSQCQIRSEYREGDTVHTQFERTRLVEDEVADEMRVYADATAADLQAMDVAFEEERVTDTTEDTAMTTETETETESVDEVGSDPDDVEMDDTADSDVESMGTESTGRTAGAMTLSEGDVGKEVVDATGATVGEVTRVTADGNEMFVDAHHGIGDRIKSALNWGSQDDEDYAIYASQVEDVDDDRIRLKGHEELDEAHTDDRT
ncbi:hypothetical protein [Halomicrobium urmianum]|uniref:hypothetical protein n=1 Tax=Halomicrobium urmianum TaxID=1586233 RepID=UPI001CDA3B3A|nr:hypothetical protein [Halomicrobium urmianum]